MKDEMRKIRDELADKALENEVYTNNSGFLPEDKQRYTNYRFHNGYTKGFNEGYAIACKRAEEILVPMLEHKKKSRWPSTNPSNVVWYEHDELNCNVCRTLELWKQECGG